MVNINLFSKSKMHYQIQWKQLFTIDRSLCQQTLEQGTEVNIYNFIYNVLRFKCSIDNKIVVIVEMSLQSICPSVLTPCDNAARGICTFCPPYSV